MVVIVLGLALCFLALAAAYFGVRTYNYVQHDNDFCLSCHLMKTPYERFARSAHRDLGCKACHRPTTVERAKMALTQILNNPEDIKAHAEVPNETCKECHVDGDPEKWRQIASSAGHRIHFESKDSSLRGLKCVECHSSSLHEFAAADKTCGQSGCHENVEIKLGKMSDLSMHCASCHEFNRPVVDSIGGDSLITTMRPTRQECLSCHAMRQIMSEIPATEPHGGVCASCHNPHVQISSAQAEQRCGECHTKADTLTPMHRGLAKGGLGKCMSCHVAHTFELDGKRCIDCHADITASTGAALPGNDPETPANSFVHPVGIRGPAVSEQPAMPTPAQQGQTQSQWQRIDHRRHRQLQCTSCHDSRQRHGEVKIRTVPDCQSCHHGGGAVAQKCATCHQPQEFEPTAYRRAVTFDMSVGTAKRIRTLSFQHGRHEKIACTSCHTDARTRSVAAANCTGCHVDHHRPASSCRECHPPTDQKVHPLQVHAGCGGAGCHSEMPAPLRGMPRTRTFCLICHQNLAQHQPARNCIDCHPLPKAQDTAWHPARPSVGGSQ